MSQKWRNKREWRIARARCIRRDKVCQICGTRQNRQVHHIDDASYHPNKRYDPDNLVCMCRGCHLHAFHILYKKGYRKKCTKDDYDRFKEISEIYKKKGNNKI